MATYKVTDTDLNRVTRLLDKVNKIAYPMTIESGVKAVHDYRLIKLREDCKNLSKEIKDTYTKIK